MRKVLLLLTVAAMTVSACAADINTTVDNELARLQSDLARVDPAGLPKDFDFLFKSAQEGIARVKNTKTPALRFYRLRQPFIVTETLLFFDAHKKAMADVASVSLLYNEEKPVHEKKRAAIRGTLLERAMQQTAINKSQKLFRASLPYAKVDTPTSGVYYLAEAHANRKFADFLASVAGDTVEAAPDKAAVGAALDALERDAITLFESDPSARTALSASAALKEARELYDQNLVEGASLVLLESRYELSKRKQRAAKSDRAPQRDDSLVALWRGVETEESDELKALVHEDVIPLLASIERGRS